MEKVQVGYTLSRGQAFTDRTGKVVTELVQVVIDPERCRKIVETLGREGSVPTFYMPGTRTMTLNELAIFDQEHGIIRY